MQHNQKKCLIIWTFILLMLIVSHAGCKKREPAVKIGENLPDVKIEEVTGSAVDFPGTLKGNYIVILFWTEGCKYCERGMPDLQKLQDKYREKGFALATIQTGGERSASVDMEKKFSLNLPMFVDSKGVTLKRYGIVGVPTMFFIDREGKVREKILGGLDGGTLDEMLRERL